MRNFISITINGGIRVWTIDRVLSSNTTVIRFFNLGGKGQEQGIQENTTAYNKRIKDKVKDGYIEVPTIDITPVEAFNLFTNNQIEGRVKEAMKCQKYDPSKFDYPCSGQPKLNGVRCYIVWGKYMEGCGIFKQEVEGVILYSMGGNRYSVPHVASQFKKEDFISDVSSGICDLYYDGELYVHGEQLNVIKKRIPIEINGVWSKPALPCEPVKFYCFDVAIDDVEYEHRRVIRYQKFSPSITPSIGFNTHMSKTDSYVVVDINQYNNNKNTFHHLGNSPIVYVHDTEIKSVGDAEAFTQNCLKAGFEGSILRSPYNLYRFGKRPKDILKIKEYKDGEFEVLDIIPKSDDKENVRGCKFICRNDINGETFKSNPEGSFDEQDEWLRDKDKYIGKRVTIKYYERSGVAKVPFHSNVITVRDYE